MVVDILRRRPAAEKPPLSTTLLKTSRLVRRSKDYPLPIDERPKHGDIIRRSVRMHPFGPASFAAEVPSTGNCAARRATRQIPGHLDGTVDRPGTRRASSAP